MTRPNTRRSNVRKPAPATQPELAKPDVTEAPAAAAEDQAEPEAVNDAVGGDAQAPHGKPEDPVNQDGSPVQGTPPDEATAADGIGEAQIGGGSPIPPAVEQAATDDAEDGDELFDTLFGDETTDAERTNALEAAVQASIPVPEPETHPDDLPLAPSADPVKVRLGHVDGVLHRIPIEVVQAILGQPALERVEFLRGSGSIDGLQKRMRVTDGRCAPMIFTSDDETKPPVLLANLDSLAAAINLGQRELSVVTVSDRDAGTIQSWLTQRHGNTAEHEHDFLERVQIRP